MWNPKLLPAPRRVTEPLQLIDVMPTILDLLELKTPDVEQGESLVYLAKGRPFRRHTPVMSSRLANAQAKPNGPVPENRIGAVTRSTIRHMLAAAHSHGTQGPQHSELSARTRGQIVYMPKRSCDDSCNT